MSSNHVSHYFEHLSDFQSPKKKQKLLGALQRFSTENYQPASKLELVAELGASHPDERSIVSTLKDLQYRVVDLLLTNDLWAILVQTTNNELALKKTHAPNSRKYIFKNCSKLELQLMMYLTLALEQKLCGETKKLAVLFTIAKAKYNFFMGVNRFFALRSSFGINHVDQFQPFCDTLSVNFRKYWTLEDYAAVSVDELLDAYRVTPDVKQRATELGEPIPTVYIPRKPHKNGFLFYLACTKNSALTARSRNHSNPYILSMLVHSRFPVPTAMGALLKFIDNIHGGGLKLTIFADAAFGSEAMVKKLSDKGHIATMSMSDNKS